MMDYCEFYLLYYTKAIYGWIGLLKINVINVDVVHIQLVASLFSLVYIYFKSTCLFYIKRIELKHIVLRCHSEDSRQCTIIDPGNLGIIKSTFISIQLFTFLTLLNQTIYNTMYVITNNRYDCIVLAQE